jgi:hypothetical protein
MDSRWREYAVTLLQTESVDPIRPLLVEAEQALNRCAAEQRLTPICLDVAAGMGFFDWDNEPGAQIAALVEEGLARRLSDVPNSYRASLRGFLQPRWLQGDQLDRTNVIKFGGLLPDCILNDYLVACVN